MIAEIQALLKKYKVIQKNSEYVSVPQVTNDLYSLLQTCRLKRLPKEER